MDIIAKSLVTAMFFFMMGWFLGCVWGFDLCGKCISIIALIFLCVASSLFGVFATLKSISVTKYAENICDGQDKFFVRVNIFGLKHKIELKQETQESQP